MSSFNFPIVMTAAGLQPQTPTSLQQQLLANVATTNPGYTANLPGSLIEDISSTDVGALALIDQAKVELVNSLTPNGANEFLLGQLGQIYLGQAAPGQPTNTSVNVVFSGTVGYVVSNGLQISDGTNTYAVQVGGVIKGSGSSSPITAIAINSGSWGVPIGTVNRIVTSVPSAITLTVNNPTTGTPQGTPETPQSFQARVWQGGLVASVGTPRCIKTLVGKLAGVQQVAVQQASPGLRVIVVGGDVYEVANAIYMSVGDPTTLVGSAISGSRDVTTSLVDYPDTYSIKSVNSPQQTVTLSVTWNTSLSDFTSGAAFPSLTQQPLVDYINSVAIGNPINVMEMNQIFQEAVEDLLDSAFLTRLVFSVFINGSVVNPTSGTYAVQGDVEGYFFAVTTGVAVAQG